VPGAHVAATRRLLARTRVPKIVDVVAGGADRQESVWRGLQRLPGDARVVIVHDAVRPFITADLVERVRAAGAGGAATCGMPVRETVKRVTDGAVEATIPRQGLWLTQTPQGLRARPAVGGARHRRAAMASPAPTTRCWWSGSGCRWQW